MSFSRRKFITKATSLAFAGLLSGLSDKSYAAGFNIVSGYGPLVPDRLLSLPQSFSYKIISKLGDRMDDGYLVPDRADGMGCFALEGTLVALIRNHEIGLDKHDPAMASMQKYLLPYAYDRSFAGEPLPGGTTTIIYDVASGKRVYEYRSLIGTLRNCAGGVTPWESWLSCEETTVSAGQDGHLDHGWVFEIPAKSSRIQKARPLKAMGRFNHEAAAVDPKTGIVYLTEDQSNSLFYRFIPDHYGQLDKGGKLQALAIMGQEKSFDTRNWGSVKFEQGQWLDAKWIDLDDIHSPKDDLRMRGRKNGAAIFARGEGIIWGDNELYFCCTTGGAKNIGQIMRYKPSINEGRTINEGHEQKNDEIPAGIQLFFESTNNNTFGLGDNLTVAPNGHLIVCEDHYDKRGNHIRGITPGGKLYTLAKLNVRSETAGLCFSPDGGTLFVNIQSPTKTLAITGPWGNFLNLNLSLTL